MWKVEYTLSDGSIIDWSYPSLSSFIFALPIDANNWAERDHTPLVRVVLTLEEEL